MAGFIIRDGETSDYEQWLPLWQGYNAFYGRSGTTALPAEITTATWERFFEPAEPVYALVAEQDGVLLGLAHYLFHRSTTKLNLNCYMQDVFTAPDSRGLGVGTALIKGVYERAKNRGACGVYWQTHHTNMAARALYDRLSNHGGFIVYDTKF